jgi:hypothetical protein
MTRKHIDTFLRPGDAETRSKSSGQNRSQVTREASKGNADKPGQVYVGLLKRMGTFAEPKGRRLLPAAA